MSGEGVSGSLEELLRDLERTPGALVPVLQRLQERFGYLPEKALEEIARYLKVPPSRIYGVATFYAQFNLAPRGR
ncbi:MAG: NAD(P)H-dependent oxidoreductase subunit E, partial [Aquificota bacterium]|nr:NAD(P)H-dependent oxidoreductase subunit E [Aquificota bacterium]